MIASPGYPSPTDMMIMPPPIETNMSGYDGLLESASPNVVM